MSKTEHKGLVPELRFPEFENMVEWKSSPFHKVFNRITDKNSENNQNALTISAQMGLVSQLEYFNKKVAAKDVSGYYLLHKGDFAYNKSYSQGYPMGAIKRLNRYDKGVVSTLYICFRAKSSYNEKYFEQYFESGLLNPEIEKIAQEGGRAHGLLNVSVKEFFKEVNFLVPQSEEQQKIADCLSSIDELISAQSQKLEALKSHKKGLMQQLFPAEGETVPKLRFPEFRGDWNSYVLKDITTYVDYRGKGPVKSGKGMFLVTAKNIKDGYLDYETSKEFVPIEDYDNVMRKGKPKIGDVLFTTEAPLGNVAQVDNENIALAQRVIKFRGGQLLSNTYLKHYMLADVFQNLIKSKATGSAAQGIQGKVLHHLSIKVPKKVEQQKIADCLSSIDELISAQSQKIESLKAHKKGLMQKLFPIIDKVGV